MIAGPAELQHAVELLRRGGLVAFPTETVYGLGADAFNADAVRRVFLLKGRPARNPLIVHVSGPAMARRVCHQWPDAAERLTTAFWPGPLSIVLPRCPQLPDIITAGGPTVAVRCPRHFTTLSLLRRLARPLVGPSANLSGRLSPTTASHVREAFDPSDVYVLDGGPCTGGIESTVVKLEPHGVTLLRPGLITPGQIAAVAGPLLPAAADQPGAPLQSPGRLDSHYAPAAPAVLADAREIEPLARCAPGPVVVLALSEPPAPRPGIEIIPMPPSPRAYAADLYRALRAADARSPALIIIERPPAHAPPDEAALWAAILDRLSRATQR